ncbi:efflux RND transporter periplasmic adaptor subunit [bacterium]|nr:efflux RND transporter periplasmic adaptor subunit [bacterium]
MAVQKKRKKRLIKIIAGLVVVIIIILLVGRSVARGNKVQEIKTSKVQIGKVVEKITETGNIELLRTVEVKSKIAGTVTTINVREGDWVHEGQILCVIDPDPNQTLLLFQKRSAVDRTKIELDRSRKELERTKELAKTSMVSDKQVEDAENAVRIAQNAYSLSKLELEIMEREIETTGSGTEERIVTSKVRAPLAGVITQRYIEEGVLVTSGISSMLSGTNLFQIGDPSTMIIRANISEVDIGKVFVEAPVDIMLDAYPDTSFAGKIRHISPVGKLQQGRNVISFNTEIEIIDKDPRLKPGMSCDVDVIIAKVDSVPFLPLESVYEKKDGTKEEGNLTLKNIIYLKTKQDSTKVAKKKRFAMFKKDKKDPFKDFDEKEIEIGIKSENRVQVIADYDTTTVVALDAEKFFKDLEAKKKADAEKKKKEKKK